MAVMRLTKGYETIVDDDVAELCDVIGFSWYAHVQPHTVYALRNTALSRQPFYLHRWILGHPPGVYVDHRNGNGLDNRRENLRLASQSQNNANSVIIRNAVGVRGVKRIPSGLFLARIKIHGQEIYLGCFKTAAEAAGAYEAARLRLFGGFAPAFRGAS